MTLAEHKVDLTGGNAKDRSNEELQNRVTDYLTDRDEHAFRLLRVEANHGTVTLTGRVRSYYEKQVAGSCVNVSGVLNLINNLAVPEWDDETGEFPFKL